MLVLSRKKGEQIVIDEDTIITVVEVKGNCVRLGVDAPKEKRILRKELILPAQQLEADPAAV